MAIVQSILDTELCKFNMGYFYFAKYPTAEGVFRFIDRDPEATYDEAFLEKFKAALYELENVCLLSEEFEWCCKNIPYIPKIYWEWLQGFRFKADMLTFSLEHGKFKLETKPGRLCEVSLYEVPLLTIITALKNTGKPADLIEISTRVREKVRISDKNKLYFSESGTKRRFSYVVQDVVIKELIKKSEYFKGTSNVYLAMKYDLKPIGTCTQELCSFIASQFGYAHPNGILMKQWSEVYKGNLGIYPTDTFTTGNFLNDFTRDQAKLWNGVRHDSGDPFEFIKKIVNKYQSLGIKSTEKTIVFSNALNMSLFAEIKKACSGQIKCAASIGDDLTNDIPKAETSVNIVMKLVGGRLDPKSPMRNCLMISDEPGKRIGDPEEMEYVLKLITE